MAFLRQTFTLIFVKIFIYSNTHMAYVAESECTVRSSDDKVINTAILHYCMTKHRCSKMN